MRVAVFNPFVGIPSAEGELAHRLQLAAGRLGWEGVTVGTPAELERARPDLVLMLHFNTPKLCNVPTYGCMWNPPSFHEHRADWSANILSYDGFLHSSPVIEQWLRDATYGSDRELLWAPLFTSTHLTEFRPERPAATRLMYCGINWDRSRFRSLCEALDGTGLVEFYGPPDRWGHAPLSFRGSLPFDGVSVLEALSRAGAGLVMHSAEHRRAAVPSMRVFETVAASAVAVCEDHPFIREAFGDTVLYLDVGRPVGEVVESVREVMASLRARPQEATARAEAAHSIFREQFCLERLLTVIGERHREFVARPALGRADGPGIQVIVCADRQPAEKVRRAIDGIAAQADATVEEVLLAHRTDDANAASALDGYSGPPVRLVAAPAGAPRSCLLWAALPHVRSEMFGVMDGADYYRDHLRNLALALARDPSQRTAFAGAVLKRDDADSSEGSSRLFPEPHPVGQFVATEDEEPSFAGAWLARSSALDRNLLDPGFHALEEDLLLAQLGGGHAPAFAGAWTRRSGPAEQPAASVRRVHTRRLRLVLGLPPLRISEDRLFERLRRRWGATAEEFVGGTVADLLSREPEPTEMREHLSRLANGLSRRQWVRDLTASPEAALRRADTGWLVRMVELPDAESPRADPSDRFRELWPLPNEAFVRTLYRALLGREPDPAGLASHLSLLARGADRAAMFWAVARSPEGRVRFPDPSWLPPPRG